MRRPSTRGVGVLFLLGIALALSGAGLVHAQIGSGVFGSQISIKLSPAHPSPGESVRLRAESTGLDLSLSSIVWKAGGKIIAQGAGVTEATVLAGPLGSATDIEVGVTGQNQAASAFASILPTEIDLLAESDSYTPPFYLGRALPTAGTNLSAQALARFKRTSGALVPDSDIVYTWRRNTEVLGQLSGRGKSSATIPVLHLFEINTISVEARSSDGVLSGEASISIPSISPVLTLYEDYPLVGIMYRNALSATTFIPEPEMTFAATPYFAQAASVNDKDLSYAWSVNDGSVPTSPTSPSELTINAENSNGQALIGLQVTHATNFYMNAKRSWNITLSAKGVSADPFHATQ